MLMEVTMDPVASDYSSRVCLCVSVSQSKAGPVSDYVRGEDVLDIWFDSGASWAAVLEGTCGIWSVLLHGSRRTTDLLYFVFLLHFPPFNQG